MARTPDSTRSNSALIPLLAFALILLSGTRAYSDEEAICGPTSPPPAQAPTTRPVDNTRLVTTEGQVSANGSSAGRPLARAGPKSQQTPRGTIACLLSPLNVVHQVGGPHTITLTLTDGGTPSVGSPVTFRVTCGPNVGVIGNSVTNGAGQAAFTYVSNGVAGIDTIEAAGDIQGSLFACTAISEWINLGCDLSPPDAANSPGTEHTVTATVVRDLLPLSGTIVNFQVITGPNAGVTGFGLTNGSGQAQFSYIGNGLLGTDTIAASGVFQGIVFVCSATKTWIDVECSLSPPSQTKPLGSSHIVSCVVLLNGVPAAGVAVNFGVTAGPNAGVAGIGLTNGLGLADFTFVGGGGPGIDIVQSLGMVQGVPFACMSIVQWVDVNCSLVPPADTGLVNQNHTLSATVSRNSLPEPGIAVNFSVTSGPNTGAFGAGVTNIAGQAHFTYTSNGVPGIDTLQAAGVVQGVPFVCQAFKTWVVDSDGDGVPDDVDECPNNEPGLQVDCAGRPMRDANGDCVFDAADIQRIVDELLGTVAGRKGPS